MEELFAYICENAHHAHWILFLLLLLAGLCIPISEDIILLLGGALASTCIDEYTPMHMYLWLFAGCWISAWEAFWLGRQFGSRLYQHRPFKWIVTPHRMNVLHSYYEHFGVFTFITGRFIPGGIRNALFITSGLGGMPFRTFLWRDGLGCLLATSIIFSIGYKFGEKHDIILHYFRQYELFVISIGAAVLIVLGLLYFRVARKI